MADSDDTNSYDGYDDDYIDYKARWDIVQSWNTFRPPHRCECTDCWLNHQSHMNMRLRTANHSAEVSDLVNSAYNERNKDALRARVVRDEARPETARKFSAEMESRRCRHTVIEHQGFQVSFPGLVSIDPVDEEIDSEQKTQKCVEKGLWNDEVRQRYVQLIDDFKTHTHIDNIFCIGSAFPRFHALVSAAGRSSQLLLCQPYSWNHRVNYLMTETRINVSLVSKALSPASSIYTETTAAQRMRLIAYAGITGKLITRMMCGMSGKFGAHEIPSHNAYTLAKHALVTTRRVHCIGACEILVGNRYVINAQAIRHAQDSMSTKKRTYREVLASKPVGRTTYLEALGELRILYAAQISNLITVAKQVQGGLSIDSAVNSNDQFLRMNDLKILCGKRLINMRNEAEDLNAPKDDQFEQSVRMIRFIAEFPKLFSYEISRLFGTSALRLYVATIEAQLRLAKQGCYAAMLSFAAIEPRMVDAFLCPVIARTYGGVSEKDNYNHVASRDEVLGPLLLKYRHHIPRTADVIGDMCRNSF